jgi:hypothetical protein
MATASGFDDDGNAVSDDDSTTVNFNNVPPAASLIKTAMAATVTFKVVVTNNSDAEALTLSALIDDQFGDITKLSEVITRTTCSVPKDIAVGSSYMCDFDAKVNTSPHTDTVTGIVSDNDGSTPVEPSDSATVTFE